MPFPINDVYWTNTAEFLKEHINNEDKIIANVEFIEKLPNTIAYPSSWKSELTNYQWVVIHKGMMDELDYLFLNQIVEEFIPVFANEVFVVFSKEPKLFKIDEALDHWQAFINNMRDQEVIYPILPRILKEVKKILIPLINRLDIIEQVIAKSANAKEAVQLFKQDSVTDQPDYSALSVDKIKELMDGRYNSQNAYNIVCLWDDIRSQELTRHIKEAIFPTNDSKILEIGCGTGGSASYINECQEYIGTDLSEVAISQANIDYGKKSNFKFVEMDAMKLQFEEERFDVVIAREVIEHLPNPINCIKEAFRVLKTGGTFVVTSPNRDSLHLRVNKMLGYEDFKCSFDHIKEFTFQEAVEMLTQTGFQIKDTKGAFLMPYWGINNVDSPVRHLTDNDPVTVEILRELGDRVGAEYAFCFIIICVKP
ncbi:MULTISPECIES: class I SAM-dependent methyltransferase [Cyanophyceae]|uniref:class I SAM-dependent methyltransferase n=1 Tax=Cyanophyceae TaxID=3028117 RepID=UPI00232E9794|nr:MULTISPECIES: class I SAM-dependent methyltransferase [Cyanophyceae]MDB9358342.1 methyltransferase domain-containing protein [Nodularia spumigena CS-587/03]MDB9319774.1 methyltransferase domain-containing protein [Nodularia spumigena CS-590/01A]MDB9323789.1 methyltransferase domain-containing protein [Nodularia spumigena CS-591/07A]MDB9324674.1 methyltransferase domain-containing protein [Nodularia spumigena CS-590/02]MDB9331826.1 methyltransferase domain-containing protein [Nodularia spumi